MLNMHRTKKIYTKNKFIEQSSRPIKIQINVMHECLNLLIIRPIIIVTIRPKRQN